MTRLEKAKAVINKVKCALTPEPLPDVLKIKWTQCVDGKKIVHEHSRIKTFFTRKRKLW